jgi:hypothetical protein
MGRARIVVVDALGISEGEIEGGATVSFLARAHTDDRSSAAAYEGGRAKSGAIAGRIREVAKAGALNSTASWGEAGGLALRPEGSRGAIRRPQG